MKEETEMKKKAISILLTLALCLSLLPATALAEGADDYYTDVLIPWNQTLDGDVLDSRGTLTSAAYVADNGIYEIWAGGNVLQLQAYKEQTNGVMSDVQYAFYEKTTTITTNTEGVRFRFHVVDETHITIQCIGNAAPYYNQTQYIFPQYNQPIDGMYLGWNSVSDVFLSDEPVLIELKDNDLKCVSTGRRLFSYGYPKFRKMQETLSVKKVQTFTYDGTVKLPVITGTNNNPQRTSEVNYGLNGNDTWYTKPKATEDAGFRKDGSYTAYIRVTRQKVTSSGVSGQDTFVFGPITVNIVAQAQITRDAAAIAGLTYNGKTQELVSPANGTGGTVKYSMDNANWSTDIPTARESGTYTVYYKVFGETFNDGTSTVPISDSETKSVSVTIAKQALKLNSDEVKQNQVKYFTGRKLSPPCMKEGEYGTTSKIIPADAITYGGNYLESAVGEYTATVQPSSNYTWKDGSTNSVSLNWKISSRIINLTGVTAESRPYEAGNLNVNVTWDGTIRPITIDDDAQNALDEALRDGKFTITVDPIGVMEDDAVGTNKKVRVKATMTGTDEYLNGIKLNYIGGSDHQLYVFNCANITKPEYTLIAPTAAENLTYDGAEKALLTTGASSQEETSGVTGITYSYRLGTDGAWSADIPTASAAGTYDVYYRANETTNYAETVCETPVQVTIKPCEIALPTDDDLEAATYNGSEQTASLKESYAYHDKVAFTAGQVQTNANTYSVTLQLKDSNYTWPNAQTTCTLNWTIAPKTIGIQWGNNALTYNGSEQAPTATATGLVNSDTCTITVTGGETNAGENYTATATAVGNTNYKLPDSGTTQTFTINPKAVTVSIDSKSSAYGVAIAELTATDDGIVPGDTGVYTLSTTATPTSNVGSYDITGTSNSGNYDFTFTGGTNAYTITAASLSPSVTLDGWTYGDTPKGPVVTGNTENGEVTYLYKVWSASDETYSPTVPTEAGKYSVKATIAATANYQQDVVYDDFTIVPKVLTVTGLTATDRVYDGTTNVTLTGGELSGIVAGDEGRVTAAMPTTGTIANADAGNGKLVTYATIDLTGDKSENYALRRPEVTVNISKADPNVGEVSYSGDTIYTSTPLNSITLSKTGATDGTLKLTDNQTLTAGTADYGWTFTPTDSTNYKTVIGTISLTVEGDTLSSISASGTPAKTSYQYGESFETDGLTVTATYVSGTTRDVTAEVTFGALAVGDTSIELAYQGKTCTISGLTVDKADAPMLADISVKQKYTTTSGEKDIGAAGMPDKAGVLTYAKGTETTTGTVTVTSWDVDSTGKVTYTLSGGTVNDTVTLPIKITSTNYADSTVNVVITLTDKETPTATANDITVTYTGSAVPDSAITGTASVEGSWSFKNAVPVNVADSSDSVTVVFTPADTNTYETVEDIIKVTINKATPTGTPAYTAITSDGKTLADAALAIGTITPTGGSIAWDVAADTAVTANTAYNWTYTPTDGDNYNNLTGSITPYVVSYSGGGSSSNTTTKTEKNEDGSTTTTVTDKTTGTVTETTKNTDGSTTVVETKKDGTVTETNKAADGTTGTVVTDKNGDVTEVKSSVSDKAATEAAKSGDAVTLPVEVPTAKNTGDAPAVDVTVPKSAGSVKVEIPVETVTPGTVAVIVNADGTEEIVKTSIPTENGVALTLAGSATVKIVDNAKVFVDIHPVNHWAKDAVDFASARGITGGTSATTFSPNASCTRAQIVTFLWRAAGSPEPESRSNFSDVSADAYYAKAVAWALENGITGGTGNGMFSPDATCTRSQSVTFLYRAAGSPTASDDIAFSDVAAESYYADAVAWAAQNGITSGIGSGLFGPANECSRAQIVTFLYRFMVK